MIDEKKDIDALPGERWYAKETTIEEDMAELWGPWGVSSEVDPLRAVLTVSYTHLDLGRGGCGYAEKAKMPENVKQIGASRCRMRNRPESGRLRLRRKGENARKR